jgi:IPT/TIG domain
MTTRTLNRLVLMVILTGSLRAQIVVRPDIDVNPTFGSPAGGDRVGIVFLGSARNTCATGPTCTPIVTFDGLPATVVESNAGSIIVVTPPHARGDVKISIDVSTAKYQAAFHYLTEEDYERVLMPIVVGGGGAFGTNWTSESWIANSGVDPVDVKWLACQSLISPPCPPFIHLSPTGHQVPLTPDRASAIPTPGAFIHIPRWALSQVHLNSRVVETSRQADQWGTELSFIRTTDFVRDIVLLNVPNSVPNESRFRTRLRIYGAVPRHSPRGFGSGRRRRTFLSSIRSSVSPAS